MNQVITVEGYPISIDPAGYISLTDMAKAYKNARAADVIKHWLSNQSTIDFMGMWESIYSADIKGDDFDTFKNAAGISSFTLTPQKWIKATAAIGIISKSGKYGGGTFAHQDIALEFASWISPKFKLYLIKEYQRLKEQEEVMPVKAVSGEWELRRFITKNTFALQRNAIGKYKLPHVSKSLYHAAYAEEGDILNLALWGMTANEWRKTHPQERARKENMRDSASITELTILSNLETLNAEMLKNGRSYDYRLAKLKEVVGEQRSIFLKNGMEDKFKLLV